jgi:hypothetical protein
MKIIIFALTSASPNFPTHALSVWQKGNQFILVIVISMVRRAIVSLMDRPNIKTLIVAGNVRKWKGQLLDVDLPNPRRQLKASPTTSSRRPASRRIYSGAYERAVPARGAISPTSSRLSSFTRPLNSGDGPPV